MPSAHAGQSYYVSALTGYDTNDGMSPARAWQSLDKANAVELKPGDSLLLESGSVFKGQLKPKETGIMANGEIRRGTSSPTSCVCGYFAPRD